MENVSSVGSSSSVYNSYGSAASKSTEQTEEKSSFSNVAATFEPSAKGKEAASKMSQADRSALIAQLKSDAESRQAQLVNIVQEMMGKQGTAIGQADDMWKFLAKGNLNVDPATRAQAQADIAEDGYWGVKQTSQRIFDFAMALSGGDQEQMEKMRTAFEKGFKMATQSWGKELPSISQDTYSAVQKMFDDYAASFNTDSAQA